MTSISFLSSLISSVQGKLSDLALAYFPAPELPQDTRLRDHNLEREVWRQFAPNNKHASFSDGFPAVFDELTADLTRFVSAIDWNQRWIQALLAIHCFTFIGILGFRKHPKILATTLCILIFCTALSEPFNSLASAHWKSFASANYFDSSGRFAAALYAGPLLLNATFALGLSIQAHVAHNGKNSAQAEVEHALSLVDLNPVIKTIKKKGDSNTGETSTNHAKYGSLTKWRDHAPLPPQITSYTHAPSRDPRWMAQITSSAIVNASPPQAVVKYLHKKSKTCLLDDFTVEKMVKIFKEDTDNRPLKINEVLARRNYATVEPDGGTGGLVIKLRMEISPGKGQTKAYAFSVPSLEVEREKGKVVEW